MVFHCSLRSRCSFSRPFRVCQTIRENSKSTAETQRNPHYVRVRGDDLKPRKMLDLNEVRVQYLTLAGTVSANPNEVRVQHSVLSTQS